MPQARTQARTQFAARMWHIVSTQFPNEMTPGERGYLLYKATLFEFDHIFTPPKAKVNQILDRADQ